MSKIVNRPQTYYLRIRYFIGIYIGEIPLLFRIFFSHGNKVSICSKDTDIVIEGYPRSANSYCHIAFKQAQKRKIKAAHHIHAPGQVLLGLKYNKPVIVLLRDPLDAIRSHLIRNSSLTPRLAAYGYYRFYKKLLNRSSEFVIAPFEVVINDIGEIFENVNVKYNTDFLTFNNSEENLQKVVEGIKSGSEKLSEDPTTELPLPNKKREVLKSSIKINPDLKIIQKSISIYNKYMEIYKRGIV